MGKYYCKFFKNIFLIHFLEGWTTSFNDSFSTEFLIQWEFNSRIYWFIMYIIFMWLLPYIESWTVGQLYTVRFIYFQVSLLWISVYFHFILKDVEGKIQDKWLIYLVSRRNRIAFQSTSLCGILAILFLFQ